MNTIISRDAIATWLLNPDAGGRYLQPRRDQGRDGTSATSGAGMGPEIRYVGVLLDIPPRFTGPAPQVRVGNLGLFLLQESLLSWLIDTVSSLRGSSDSPVSPLLIVPLPLVDAQVHFTLRPTTPDAAELPSPEPSRPDIPNGLEDAIKHAQVIHVVIDDTILPIHHHTRLVNGKTRYAAIWHQDGVYKEGQSSPFGRVWYRDEIDKILQQNPATIRREFGHDVSRRTGMPTGAIAMSHGSAVVDLFAGYSPREDLFAQTGVGDEKRPIIGVQLPAQVFWDSSGLALGFFISTALDFVVSVAAGMGGGEKPMVINLSYGMTAGPHDGSSFIERIIDRQLQDRRAKAATEMVLPVGNDHLARRSWRQEKNATLAFEIPPGRSRPIIIETWFDWPTEFIGSGKKIVVSLAGPDGSKLELRRPPQDTSKGPPEEMLIGTYRDVLNTDGISIGRIAFENNPAEATMTVRHRLSLMLAPTHHPYPGCPVTRPGLWRLEITPQEQPGDGLIFQAWIQRDDDPVGFPATTPGVRFRYPDRETEIEQRRFTASAKVTGKSTIVATGWRLSDGRIAPYSASYDPAENPTRRDAARPQYVFAAPSESSVALPGLRAAGNISGRGGALGGTSVAAPVLARQLADMLAAKSGTGTKVGQELAGIVKPNGKVAPPPQLATGDPRCRPGHVSQHDWLGATYGDPKQKAWTGEPAEYSQSRIGKGLLVPERQAMMRIRRR